MTTSVTSSTNITIIDYGSGNLHSAAKMFERAAQEQEIRENSERREESKPTPLTPSTSIIVTSDPKALADASHIVLPGVGAFGDCMAGLKAIPGMIEALKEQVLKNKKPFLGICVGMQLLATKGLEHGEHKGLGWIAGEVRKIESRVENRESYSLKIPHMGWNSLTTRHQPLATDSVLKGLNHKDVYFVHSYHFVPEDESAIAATVDYGGQIVAAVAHENIFGVQFHPEKSQDAGLRLIQNFIQWRP